MKIHIWTEKYEGNKSLQQTNAHHAHLFAQLNWLGWNDKTVNRVNINDTIQQRRRRHRSSPKWIQTTTTTKKQTHRAFCGGIGGSSTNHIKLLAHDIYGCALRIRVNTSKHFSNGQINAKPFQHIDDNGYAHALKSYGTLANKPKIKWHARLYIVHLFNWLPYLSTVQNPLKSNCVCLRALVFSTSSSSFFPH